MPPFDALARRRVPPAAVDVLLALSLAAATLADVHGPRQAPARSTETIGILLALAVGLPFAVHRRWPVPALLGVGTAAIALQGWHYIPEPVGGGSARVGMTLIAVAVAVFLTTVRTCGARTYQLLAMIVLFTTAAELWLYGADAAPSAVAVDVLMVTGWALGGLIGARRALAQDAVEYAAAVEREQVALARTAVVEERARIARELHDIVAHNVSLMVVQVIAAERLQDRDRAKSRELHATIEQTGRATVVELRRLLEVLRTEEEEGAGRTPQPGIADIPRLLDGVREAGLHVDAQSRGLARPLPAGTELTAYRIVQEALTNTLKHAGPTRTSVTLDWQDELLTVTVSDNGRLPGGGELGLTGSPASGRHGLVGMRERVLAVGGTLHTGPRPKGGFLVRAALPTAPTPREDGPAL